MKTKDYGSVVAVIACIAAAAWLPLLGFLFTLAGTVLCGLLYTRRGWYPVIVCAVFGFAAAYLVAWNWQAPLVLTTGVILPGCAMMFVWKKKFGMKEIVTAGTVGFLAQTLLDFGLVQMQTGKNMFSEMVAGMQNDINTMLPQLRQMLEAAGGANVEENMQLLTQTYGALVETVAQLIPAILFVCCCALAYIALCFCTAFLKKRGEDTEMIVPFTQMRAPRSVALVLLLAFALSLLVPQTVIRGAAFNITMILFAYFILCGISLLCFFMKRLFPRVLLRTLIAVPMVVLLITMLMLPILNPLQLFLLAGILDSAFHFRRFARRSDVL